MYREAAIGKHAVVRRRQLRESAKDRARVWHVLQRQVVVESSWIDLPLDSRHLQQAFQFAGEQQAIRFAAIIERFLAQPVAGDDKPALPGIPNRQREHAVEVFQKAEPFVFVEMDNCFGVAAGAKSVAGALQPLSQLAVVVDLAVKDDPHRLVFVRKRLVASLDVDDRQTAMPECYAGHQPVCRLRLQPARVATRVIRTAVAEHFGHSRQHVGRECRRMIGPDCSGDSTHNAYRGLAYSQTAPTDEFCSRLSSIVHGTAPRASRPSFQR